ncbi:MAG: potassium-transporting ATPase subunit KdpC [Bacteroidetes bacterium]|nr:potassium-transporting ATPase subunit KdpC [Bacteroidota bacterium]
MKTTILQALRMLLVMTVFTGIIYPVAMTFLSLAVFPYQAKGSMIEKNGTIIGSELIGQRFVSDKYFNSRPSGIGYNPAPSSGTNWGPTDKRMQDSANARTAQFKLQNNLSAATVVPKDMLFASASGVDPHISPEAAQLQIERIAKVRGFNPMQLSSLKKLVEDFTEGPQMKLFGNPRVNVLKLNLAVDELQTK